MILASDLDRTLIYSKNAIQQFSDVPVEKLYTAEHYKGQPFSFMTKQANELTEDLIEKNLLVPVTTRVRHQYDRIKLSNKKRPEWAIIANGAEVLKNGKPDPEWNEHISGLLKEEAAPIDKIEQKLEKFHGEDWLLKQRIADSWYIYLNICREKLPSIAIDETNTFAEKNNWQMSIQGSKLYLVPKPINKENAINYICDKLNINSFMAAGDSLLDQPLVESAELGIIPAHGELYEKKISGSIDTTELQITKASGIHAGEEILQLAKEYLD